MLFCYGIMLPTYTMMSICESILIEILTNGNLIPKKELKKYFL